MEGDFEKGHYAGIHACRRRLGVVIVSYLYTIFHSCMIQIRCLKAFPQSTYLRRTNSNAQDYMPKIHKRSFIQEH